MQVREMWLGDTRYLLLNGHSILPENWQGEVSYAYLNEEGDVMRYQQRIARLSDIRFGEMVEIEITPEIVTSLFYTIFGAEENDNVN